MEQSGKKLTRHHRLPTSIGGTDDEKNISMVTDTKHQAWHTLFQNKHAVEICKEINDTWLDPKYELVIVNRLRSRNRGTA